MSITNPSSLNEKNFQLVVELLDHIEAFPFFGTLLGLHRDGELIPGDDDVDFYVNINQRDELINILSESHFDIDLNKCVNNTKYFIQATRTEGDVTSKVDFYFFQKESSMIKERWNFSGKPLNDTDTLHTPIDYIYPLKKCEYHGVSFDMPSHPSLVCEHLYGERWMHPKKENMYETHIINNHPEIITYSQRTQTILKTVSSPNLVLSASKYYDRGGITLLIKKTGLFFYDCIS